jgi:hypothetical protein
VEKYLPSKNKGTGFSPKQPSLIRTEAWSDQCKKKKKTPVLDIIHKHVAICVDLYHPTKQKWRESADRASKFTLGRSVLVLWIVSDLYWWWPERH